MVTRSRHATGRLRVPPTDQRREHRTPIVNPHKVIVCFQVETLEVQDDAVRTGHMNVEQPAFVVPVISGNPTGIRERPRLRCDERFRWCIVDEFIVQIPVPVMARVGVCLARIVLMASDMCARRGAAQTVNTIVQHRTVIQRIAVEHPVRLDIRSSRTNVLHQICGRLVHIHGEVRIDVAVRFVLDADGITVGDPDMPRLVGLGHHLGDLPVHGTDHIMGGHTGAAVLEPCDGTGIRTLCVMDGDRGDRRPSPTR